MTIRLGRLRLRVFFERVKPWWSCRLAFADPGWRWFWIGPVNVHYAIRPREGSDGPVR